MELTDQDLDSLQSLAIDDLTVARQTLVNTIGARAIASGFWRFFSESHPESGAAGWNRLWCKAWGLSDDGVYAFGEDAFGNQLLLIAGQPTAFICDHENGECQDLELSIPDLLTAVREHGIGWIDFYGNGSVAVASGFLSQMTWEMHLHWQHPLVLGGGVSADNAVLVERCAHLIGHQKLWEQIQGDSPGEELCPQ